jgi:hypothetical protein
MAENGIVKLDASFSDAKSSFVRDVYNALKNGSDTVVVFAHNADDAIVGAFADAATDTDTLILQSHDVKVKGRNKGQAYSAKDLRAAIERRNASNPSAPGDTWGTVSTDNPIGDPNTGELIGFTVS